MTERAPFSPSTARPHATDRPTRTAWVPAVSQAPAPPRFGMVMPSQGPFGDLTALPYIVQAAEALGFDGAWFGERVAVPAYASSLTPSNWFEALACCLVGIGATTRLRFGTDVLVAPYRNPVVLARQLATADQLSRGGSPPGWGGLSAR
jgi:alkanesulfonate monooxygenase SsuD/methylene tetrahydromethanopterin reductase-like flavin-dependent oxidoreductase (luciferase family)